MKTITNALEEVFNKRKRKKSFWDRIWISAPNPFATIGHRIGIEIFGKYRWLPGKFTDNSKIVKWLATKGVTPAY